MSHTYVPYGVAVPVQLNKHKMGGAGLRLPAHVTTLSCSSPCWIVASVMKSSSKTFSSLGVSSLTICAHRSPCSNHGTMWPGVGGRRDWIGGLAGSRDHAIAHRSHRLGTAALPFLTALNQPPALTLGLGLVDTGNTPRHGCQCKIGCDTDPAEPRPGIYLLLDCGVLAAARADEYVAEPSMSELLAHRDLFQDGESGAGRGGAGRGRWAFEAPSVVAGYVQLPGSMLFVPPDSDAVR